MVVFKRLLGLGLGFACAVTSAFADPMKDEATDTSATNLIVVLRESLGENKVDESLQPYGRVTAQLPDGRRIELATSWYQYLGDMHIRLVFDAGNSLQSASPNDLERLGLTPEHALDTAIANLRRVYGTPHATPWNGGLMQVQGSNADLASSYFLDRQFWLAQVKHHPEGVVAAVPQRGGLVFASADDGDALEVLRFSAAALYAGGGGTRISSALYLFKDGRWSIFQPPQRQ
ncbi:MAG TPA: hypothetical protein VMZ74_13080 [Ramlibacter sp.]|nr:hypothetical protein [Ramlibacter sp.]